MAEWNSESATMHECMLEVLTSRVRALASPAAPHGQVDREKPSVAASRGAQRFFSTRSLDDGAITVLSNGRC